MDLVQQANTALQRFLDRSAPHKLYRWLALAALIGLYAFRIVRWGGFYIITYAIGIYNLNLLLGFITPSVDPELEGPVLPQKQDEEYRPFRRRLQEMKFWCASRGGRLDLHRAMHVYVRMRLYYALDSAAPP